MRRRHLLRRLLAGGAVALVAAACVPSTPAGESTATTTTSTTVPDTTSGFIAFGDAGTGDAVQQQVADMMEVWAASHEVNALVEAGDAVYPDGNPSSFAARLDTPYADLRVTAPLWVALGNHDIATGHGQEELSYLGLPALPYVKTLPQVQLLFLDANHPDQAQADWLEARLSEAGPPFRVVVFHQPPYSCGVEHGNDAAVIQYWVPILEAHQVALVVTGHEHYYERFLSANGVTYVVTGGGGASIYARNASCTGTPPSQATAQRHHFVGVEVNGNTMTLTTVARTGETLDTATITR